MQYNVDLWKNTPRTVICLIIFADQVAYLRKENWLVCMTIFPCWHTDLFGRRKAQGLHFCIHTLEKSIRWEGNKLIHQISCPFHDMDDCGDVILNNMTSKLPPIRFLMRTQTFNLNTYRASTVIVLFEQMKWTKEKLEGSRESSLCTCKNCWIGSFSILSDTMSSKDTTSSTIGWFDTNSRICWCCLFCHYKAHPIRESTLLCVFVNYKRRLSKNEWHLHKPCPPPKRMIFATQKIVKIQGYYSAEWTRWSSLHIYSRKISALEMQCPATVWLAHCNGSRLHAWLSRC